MSLDADHPWHKFYLFGGDIKMFQESWVTDRFGHGRMLRKTVTQPNPAGREFAVLTQRTYTEREKISQIQTNLPRNQRVPAQGYHVGRRVLDQAQDSDRALRVRASLKFVV